MSKKILIVDHGQSGLGKMAIVEGIKRRLEETDPMFLQCEMGGRSFEEVVKLQNEVKQQADVDRLINSFSDENLRKYEDAKKVYPMDIKTGKQLRREKRAKQRVKFKNKKI